MSEKVIEAEKAILVSEYCKTKPNCLGCILSVGGSCVGRRWRRDGLTSYFTADRRGALFEAFGRDKVLSLSPEYQDEEEEKEKLPDMWGNVC